jgi:ABC-type transporter Mla subunit MlaD
VEPTVELDEILGAFDPGTRQAFHIWQQELARTITDRGQDFSDALGNLPAFSTDASALLKVLYDQSADLTKLVRNTGTVFEALSSNAAALHDVITNSEDTFRATAAQNESLAQTFSIFPTFLRESRATLARLDRFAINTHPLVNALKGPADDLGPTIHDLGRLAPDLKRLFIKLDRLRVASRGTVPQLERVVRGLGPVFDQLVPFFQELNPILSYFNFYQARIAGFISNGAANLASKDPSSNQRIQVQVGIIDGRSFERETQRQDWERGNAYLQPNALTRALALGTIESYDCSIATGKAAQGEPEDNESNLPEIVKASGRRAPCLVQPGSLYDGNVFSIPQFGRAPLVPPPDHTAGNPRAVDPHPNDPLH